MELTCNQCHSKFRAAVDAPLMHPVRLICPSCGNPMVLKPKGTAAIAHMPHHRIAVIADEPRPFRLFLGEHLEGLGFDVHYFDKGDAALDFIQRTRAELAIVNVYLKGKLGVEVSEAVKADPNLTTRVILIGALFRANRFRANPTNLYGADEYIEEQIPEREFREIICTLFPEIGERGVVPLEAPEYDDARRLARLILSDIIIQRPEKVEEAVRANTFFESLREEIEEGRKYYDARVPFRVRQNSEIYIDTLRQFVDMKREELERLATGTE